MQKMLKTTARGLIDQIMTILSLLNSRMVITSLLGRDVCRVSLQIGEAPGRGKELRVYPIEEGQDVFRIKVTRSTYLYHLIHFSSLHSRI